MAEYSAADDKKLLDECTERLQDCMSREADERTKMKKDLRFVALDQWPEQIRNQRENDPNGPRPCLTIDKINQYRMQIINEIRKNRPAAKIRPVDDDADPDTAQVFQGLTRHIEDISSADIAYETAAEWAIDTGVGYFRFTTDYSGDREFQQEILIKPVVDGFSVYLGPHLLPDGSDAEYGFVLEDIPKDTFDREYPKAKATGDLDEGSPFWAGEDSTRMAEYFYFVHDMKTIVRLDDGRVVTKEEYDKIPETFLQILGVKKSAKPKIVEERKTDLRSVKWCKLTAAEILQRRDWAGKYIPIVKVVGHQKIVDGKKLTWGIIRPAIDSARMYNYWSSAITERMALAPKMPFVGAKGQFEGQEAKWAKANTENAPYLEYNPTEVNGNALPAPQRVAPAQTEVAMVHQLQIIEHDIQTSLGMFKASVGEQTGDQSGRAINALQNQSDTATYHFPSNLALSIRHGGRIMVDLAPKIYDTARVIRIIGDDGKPKTVQLNPNQDVAMRKLQDAAGKVKKIYNIGVGKYDVTVTVGPNFATRRMETVDFMTNAIKGNPNLMPIIGDLMFKAVDMPMADQIADRLHRMLPAPILQGETEDQIPPIATAKIMQLTQQIQLMQEEGAKMLEENKRLKTGADEAQARTLTQAAEARDALALKREVAKEESDLEYEKMLREDKRVRDKAALDAATKVTVAQISAKADTTQTLIQAEAKANLELSGALDGAPEAAMETASAVPDKETPVQRLANMHQQHMEAIGKLIPAISSGMSSLNEKIDNSKPISVESVKDKNGKITHGIATYANGDKRTITVN